MPFTDRLVYLADLFFPGWGVPNFASGSKPKDAQRSALLNLQESGLVEYGPNGEKTTIFFSYACMWPHDANYDCTLLSEWIYRYYKNGGLPKILYLQTDSGTIDIFAVFFSKGSFSHPGKT